MRPPTADDCEATPCIFRRLPGQEADMRTKKAGGFRRPLYCFSGFRRNRIDYGFSLVAGVFHSLPFHFSAVRSVTVPVLTLRFRAEALKLVH